jgi:hypothetical protein
MVEILASNRRLIKGILLQKPHYSSFWGFGINTAFNWPETNGYQLPQKPDVRKNDLCE